MLLGLVACQRMRLLAGSVIKSASLHMACNMQQPTEGVQFPSCMQPPPYELQTRVHSTRVGGSFLLHLSAGNVLTPYVLQLAIGEVCCCLTVAASVLPVLV